MKTWKYKRKPPKNARNKQDDKACLAHHHKDVPGKFKAKDARHSALMARQALQWEDGSVVAYSTQKPATAKLGGKTVVVSKWVRCKFWMRKNP